MRLWLPVPNRDGQPGVTTLSRAHQPVRTVGKWESIRPNRMLRPWRFGDTRHRTCRRHRDRFRNRHLSGYSPTSASKAAYFTSSPLEEGDCLM